MSQSKNVWHKGDFRWIGYSYREKNRTVSTEVRLYTAKEGEAYSFKEIFGKEDYRAMKKLWHWLVERVATGPVYEYRVDNATTYITMMVPLVVNAQALARRGNMWAMGVHVSSLHTVWSDGFGVLEMRVGDWEVEEHPIGRQCPYQIHEDNNRLHTPDGIVCISSDEGLHLSKNCNMLNVSGIMLNHYAYTGMTFPVIILGRLPFQTSACLY